MNLIDRFGRRLDYLRISVTDRCNLRCVYCMPPEGIESFPKEYFLTFEEFARVVRVAASLGFRKVRLTGGEPLVRRGLPDLVRMIAPHVESVSLTTNGILLDRLAAPLAEAGLRTVNVSLDSLEDGRFRRITRGGELGRVWAGIGAARDAGLRIKLNVVGLRDLTLSEAYRFVRLSIARGLEVRFIEFMPLCGSGWRREEFTPLTALEQALRRRFRMEPEPSDGASRTYRVAGTRGRIGFIASLSRPFCSTCSRLRLSATGRLQVCLFSPLGIELLPLLRGGAGDEGVAEAFRKAAGIKPAGHEFDPDRPTESPALIRSIGG